MSQPRLNRGLILDLLDKLRNPGKGAPVVEIEDEEPEVRAPWTKRWKLPDFAQAAPLPRALFCCLSSKEKGEGGGGASHRAGDTEEYGRARGSQLGPQGGRGARGPWP